MSSLNPSQKGQGVALSKSSEVAIQPKNPDFISLEATEVRTVYHVFGRMQDLAHLKDMFEKATVRVKELEDFTRVISDESGFTLIAHHPQSKTKLEFTNLKGNTEFTKKQLEIGKTYLKELEASIQNFTL